MMETNKVLSALCYFSIVFAGFIFPLIVFFVTNDDTTKQHAKKAFISHLCPLIPLPVLGICVYFDVSRGHDAFPVLTIICAAVMVLISIMVFLWNIVKGVKVLSGE